MDDDDFVPPPPPMHIPIVRTNKNINNHDYNNYNDDITPSYVAYNASHSEYITYTISDRDSDAPRAVSSTDKGYTNHTDRQYTGHVHRTSPKYTSTYTKRHSEYKEHRETKEYRRTRTDTYHTTHDYGQHYNQLSHLSPPPPPPPPLINININIEELKFNLTGLITCINQVHTRVNMICTLPEEYKQQFNLEYEINNAKTVRLSYKKPHIQWMKSAHFPVFTVTEQEYLPHMMKKCTQEYSMCTGISPHVILYNKGRLDVNNINNDPLKVAQAQVMKNIISVKTNTDIDPQIFWTVMELDSITNEGILSKSTASSNTGLSETLRAISMGHGHTSYLYYMNLKYAYACKHWSIDDVSKLFKESYLRTFIETVKIDIKSKRPLPDVHNIKEQQLELLQCLGVDYVFANGIESHKLPVQNQEMAYRPYLISQLIVAMSLLRTGGNLVIKILDFQTDFTYTLLSVLYTLFEKTTIIQPVCIHPCSPDRYCIFVKRKPITHQSQQDWILNLLYKCYHMTECYTFPPMLIHSRDHIDWTYIVNTIDTESTYLSLRRYARYMIYQLHTRSAVDKYVDFFTICTREWSSVRSIIDAQNNQSVQQIQFYESACNILHSEHNEQCLLKHRLITQQKTSYIYAPNSSVPIHRAHHRNVEISLDEASVQLMYMVPKHGFDPVASFTSLIVLNSTCYRIHYTSMSQHELVKLPDYQQFNLPNLSIYDSVLIGKRIYLLDLWHTSHGVFPIERLHGADMRSNELQLIAESTKDPRVKFAQRVSGSYAFSHPPDEGMMWICCFIHEHNNNLPIWIYSIHDTWNVVDITSSISCTLHITSSDAPLV
jgi:hypothetical protein